MNFSALSGTDRMAALSAVVVLITSIISLVWAWGALMLLPLVAGLFVLFVVFQPSVAPTVKLPMTHGFLLLVGGAAAALFWAVVALEWLGYIFEHLLSLDVLQFFVGFIAALAMAFFGWQAFQADKGTAGAAPPSAPSAPVPPAPPAA